MLCMSKMLKTMKQTENNEKNLLKKILSIKMTMLCKQMGKL